MTSVRAAADGGFVVELADRRLPADQVVVATGPFQVPRLPVDLAERPRPGDRAAAQQPTTARPAQIAAERTRCVVGGGGTPAIRSPRSSRARPRGPPGDRHPSGADAPAPARPRHVPLPRPPGAMTKTPTRGSAGGCRTSETLVGYEPRGAAPAASASAARVTGADGRSVGSGDGSASRPARWSGRPVRADHAFVELPLLRRRGGPRHRRGVTAVAWSVLPRAALAAHARLGAAGLGQGRRGTPGRRDRAARGERTGRDRAGCRMTSAVGSIGWTERTGGVLTARECLTLARPLLRDELGSRRASWRWRCACIRAAGARRTGALMPPDSSLAGDAQEAAQDLLTPVLRNHSHRAYAWAAAIAARRGIAFDRELLYLAAMFHDTGLPSPVPHVDFTVRSAAAGPRVHRPPRRARRQPGAGDQRDRHASHAPGSAPTPAPRPF